MNLKLSLAVTPSQAPTRPSAVATCKKDALMMTIISQVILMLMMKKMVMVKRMEMKMKMTTSLSCRRPRVSASFSLA